MNKIGVLGINKPSGITSFDVVRLVKKITGIKKTGHGGTLDPMATGVLPVLLNEATAFFDVLLNSKKTYRTKIQLGKFTDTDDKEGEVIQELPVKTITLEMILEKIPLLTGEILQEPPIYSALKINGKKAYELARSGQEVVLEPRKVQVYSWDNVSYDHNNKIIEATITCGSGTYIRSLGRDLAKILGTGGHLIELCRFCSGGINLDDAIELEELEQQWEQKLVLPEKALSFLPSLEWEGDLTYLIHGKPLSHNINVPSGVQDGLYRLMYQDKIVALIEYQNNRFTYRKNLASIYIDM